VLKVIYYRSGSGGLMGDKTASESNRRRDPCQPESSMTLIPEVAIPKFWFRFRVQFYGIDVRNGFRPEQAIPIY
jgi:hypothetical protein